jgi:RNA methyltransferase, TrmH family
MITKNQIKYIQSLQLKKNRILHKAFTVEGAKNVLELLASSLSIELLFVTEHFYKENRIVLDNQTCQFEIVSITDLERLGTFASNNAAFAVVKTYENIKLFSENDLVLVLDDIRDPGNLGTIIRIADWYGIKKIICSENTVDFYNPKVIAATMGSFARINLYYTDLAVFFKENKAKYIAGAIMNGTSIYESDLPKTGYLVIGNESNGISDEIMEVLTHKLTIPKRGGAESLNAGVATAILLDNFFRKR